MPPQGAPAQDPMAGAPSPQGEPAVSSEMAAMMEKVIQTVESQGKAFESKTREQEQRINMLEQELAKDKQIREERRKVIETVLPSV